MAGNTKRVIMIGNQFLHHQRRRTLSASTVLSINNMLAATSHHVTQVPPVSIISGFRRSFHYLTMNQISNYPGGYRHTRGQSSTTPQSNHDQSHLGVPKSDPSTKRPTRKCDPYGLQGESLSYDQCMDWMTTLEGGWILLPPGNDSADNVGDGSHSQKAKTINRTPQFLQKHFYHSTFHKASQFLSHLSLLATNLNHYPTMSMERILVDDLNNVHEAGDSFVARNSGMPKTSKRRTKGWVFRSTVCCSTYRPPTSGSSYHIQPDDDNARDDFHRDEGLTYHDFHLAMSIDVEASRENIKPLMWSGPHDP
ncbi:hypothetical protein ACHAWF_015622 [Thalassiosira exigua]